MSNNLIGIQYSANYNNLDGLSIIDADQIYIDGKLVDLSNLVPYTGANKTINLGAQNIQTTHSATVGADLVNLTLLQSAIGSQDTINALNFLSKLSTTAQNVAGAITWAGGQTFNGAITSNGANYYSANQTLSNGLTVNNSLQIQYPGSYTFVDFTNWSLVQGATLTHTDPQNITVACNAGENQFIVQMPVVPPYLFNSYQYVQFKLQFTTANSGAQITIQDGNGNPLWTQGFLPTTQTLTGTFTAFASNNMRIRIKATFPSNAQSMTLSYFQYKIPYMTVDTDATWEGTNKIYQNYNATTSASDALVLVNRQTMDSAIASSGVSLSGNNTWTGLNTFNGQTFTVLNDSLYAIREALVATASDFTAVSGTINNAGGGLYYIIGGPNGGTATLSTITFPYTSVLYRFTITCSASHAGSTLHIQQNGVDLYASSNFGPTPTYTTFSGYFRPTKGSTYPVNWVFQSPAFGGSVYYRDFTLERVKANVNAGLGQITIETPPAVNSDVVNKFYCDSVSGTTLLASTNTWTGTSNTFNKTVNFGMNIAMTGQEFTVGGNSTTFYPVLIDSSPSWYGGGKFYFGINRGSVHTNAPPNGKGAITSWFEGHNTNWGNGADYISWNIVNSAGWTYTRFIAGVQVDDRTTFVVVWLRGGLTYYFTGNGAYLQNGNSGGTSLQIPMAPPSVGTTYNTQTTINTGFDANHIQYDGIAGTNALDGIVYTSEALILSNVKTESIFGTVDWLRINGGFFGPYTVSCGRVATYGALCVNDTMNGCNGLCVGAWDSGIGVGNGYFTGNIGIGKKAEGRLDIDNNGRTGTHAPARALYATYSGGEYSSGIAEFRHTNGTQGVGIGYAGIYSCGSNTNQDMTVCAKGLGNVYIRNNGTTTLAYWDGSYGFMSLNGYSLADHYTKQIYRQNVSWGGGLWLGYAFYKIHANSLVNVWGYATGYCTGAQTMSLSIGVYSYQTGTYRQWIGPSYFTNNTYNHAPYPFTCQFLDQYTTGWYAIYIVNGGGFITDGNDYVGVNITMSPPAIYN